MPIAILIVALLGGGGMLAARSSVPGDVLYPVKVSVNENLQNAVAVSGESQARVDATLALRRLEEAATLSADGRLSSETVVRLEENFELQAKRAEARIEKLAETDARAAADIAANFEVALGAHEAILARVMADADIETSSETSTTLVPILLKLRETQGRVAGLRAAADAGVEAQGDADLGASAEARLNEARLSLEAAKRASARAGSSLKAGAETQLQAAAIMLERAEAELEAKAHAASLVASRASARISESVATTVRGATRLDLDLLLPVFDLSLGSEVNQESGADTEGTSGNADEANDGLNLEVGGGVNGNAGDSGTSGVIEGSVNANVGNGLQLGL
ncbi:MAG: hypothetical protein COV10_01525 [Candidatus Vogelbacteria bacterium CG10_big_fil_rev_8_21_14_0_10_51_16]|uniref:DUF5667 domain-containing protein n=1 Tax=Candidatus Vogelbacteria bacterium CG10_big_fil_rev_8_21_14_0_10_51_16 TaxID=1975045 RepID=A0A2H0REU6_9BACT|nr:MAG: hypothetical protein COV10_01525 [Candidatus Vogelbacteria bacterium CG10_big_fil_rev_8_21_14_0_10_51_16]